MNHRRHVEFDHLLIQRIPPVVGQRRIATSSRRTGSGLRLQPTNPSSLTQRSSSAMQLAGATPGRLRQLADRRRSFWGTDVHDAVDQVIAQLASIAGWSPRADMVRHARGTRREDGDVGAALPLQPKLRTLNAGADLVIADAGRGERAARLVGKAGELLVAK